MPIVWNSRLSDLREANDAQAKFRALGPDKIVRFDHKGQEIRLFVPRAMHDKMQMFTLLVRDFHELPLLQAVRDFISPSDLVIDAGANLGNHTVYFGAICGAEVISLEPQAEVFKVLRKNAQLNNVRGQAIHAAAGAQAGTAKFVKARGDNSGTAQFAAGRGDVTMVALDDIVQDRTVRLMKIDVEGMQMDLLTGADKIIARSQPIIWMELRPGRGEVEEPSAYLAERGYRRHQMTFRDFLFLPEAI